MIRYEVVYACNGIMTNMYEILVWWNKNKVGCIYYLEDQLKSSVEADFDEWRHYRNFKDEVGSIHDNTLEIAQQVILEYHLLETDSINM